MGTGFRLAEYLDKSSPIATMYEGERPKPLPHPKTVYVAVYVSVH